MGNTYEEKLKMEWEKFSSKKNKFFPNIMLLGATGCGKSSLINLIFDKEIAPVNDVSRGTTEFKTYWGADYDMNVNLIDSRGYEMEDRNGETFSNYYKAIKNKLEESTQKDPLEKIHIIWFCISVAGKRVQAYDIEILKLLQKEPELKNRVAIVLTKCDEDDEDGNIAKKFKKIISSDIKNSIPSFEVSTDLDLKLDLKNLMVWSSNQLDDEDLKEAFISSQMVSLKMKQKAAQKKIAFYAASAAAIGATPIPMTDSALLIPLQCTMSTHIIHIYGMENFASISSALLGDIIVSNLGKSLAGGLIKLIPGIGTLIGGVINAGVASLITSALGFAISTICFESCKKIANGESIDMSNVFGIEAIQTLVKQYMSHNKNT